MSALQLFEPTVIPVSLAASHRICEFCQDLVPHGDLHPKRCRLTQSAVQLVCGGWATPASERLRRDLRRVRPYYRRMATNLVAYLMDAQSPSDVVVPIPIGSQVGGNAWAAIVAEAAAVYGAEYGEVIERRKMRSTRDSLAQERAVIVGQEYQMINEGMALVKNRQVTIIDDNVTTGATIQALANLISQAGASQVRAISLDRSLSARLLQRCVPGGGLFCGCFEPRARSASFD